MSEMFQELLKSSPYAIIELYELHLVRELHGSAEVVRFHGGVNQKLPAGDVVWQTQIYQALPIEVEGFEYSGNGQLPRPKVRVANLLGGISAILLGVNEVTPGNDLTGAKFIRIRTLSRFLDPVNFTGGVNPYGTPSNDEMPREIYYIDRKANENKDLVEFELAAVFDLAGVRAPKRQCIANICQWTYRGPECGYTGTTYFDEYDDTVSTEPAPNIAATFSALGFGQNLFSPNQMVSSNGWYKAVMQSDGNLVVISKNGTIVWASNSVRGEGSYRLRNGVDGDLTIIDVNANAYIWRTNTANQGVGVTSVDYVRDGNGAIGWVPADILEGRSGAFGYELFGSAGGGGSASATRTFYSPTSISPGRYISVQFTAISLALPAGHFSGQSYKWELQGITRTASGGFWNLNETFNATVSVGGGNPFRNTQYGTLTYAGPQVQITGTSGYANNNLVIQTDGNFVLYNSSGQSIWASNFSSNIEPLIVSQAGSLVTVDPAKDVCGKRLSSCKARFGANASLPFGSFPSLGATYG
jgi:lambda family phage minor tail protein L